MMPETKSIWWALQCAFWYWWDHGLPLFTICWHRSTTAWWHGFQLRDCYNDPSNLMGEPEGDHPRDAVSTDVSYWEP